jgi:hypothetical protein
VLSLSTLSHSFYFDFISRITSHSPHSHLVLSQPRTSCRIATHLILPCSISTSYLASHHYSPRSTLISYLASHIAIRLILSQSCTLHRTSLFASFYLDLVPRIAHRYLPHSISTSYLASHRYSSHSLSNSYFDLATITHCFYLAQRRTSASQHRICSHSSRKHSDKSSQISNSFITHTLQRKG